MVRITEYLVFSGGILESPHLIQSFQNSGHVQTEGSPSTLLIPMYSLNRLVKQLIARACTVLILFGLPLEQFRRLTLACQLHMPLFMYHLS